MNVKGSVRLDVVEVVGGNMKQITSIYDFKFTVDPARGTLSDVRINVIRSQVQIPNVPVKAIPIQPIE